MRLFLLAVLAAAFAPAAAGASSFCDQTARRLAPLQAQCETVPCAPTIARLVARLERGYTSRCIHLNQIQVLGTHNSYHIRPQEPLWSALLAFNDIFDEWDYTHLPLDQQFETQGIRQIE